MTRLMLSPQMTSLLVVCCLQGETGEQACLTEVQAVLPGCLPRLPGLCPGLQLDCFCVSPRTEQLSEAPSLSARARDKPSEASWPLL